MNERAMLTTNPKAVNTVYNTAVGDRTTLNDLVKHLKEYLSKYDAEIVEVEVVHASEQAGRYSAFFGFGRKSKELLGYQPTHTIEKV